MEEILLIRGILLWSCLLFIEQMDTSDADNFIKAVLYDLDHAVLVHFGNNVGGLCWRGVHMPFGQVITECWM